MKVFVSSNPQQIEDEVRVWLAQVHGDGFKIITAAQSSYAEMQEGKLVQGIALSVFYTDPLI